MATFVVRLGSLSRSLARRFSLNGAPRANKRAQMRTLLRLDKLGVTGSSPVPPMFFPAGSEYSLLPWLTGSISQVMVN
jgi:hypothetical protein